MKFLIQCQTQNSRIQLEQKQLTENNIITVMKKTKANATLSKVSKGAKIRN